MKTTELAIAHYEIDPASAASLYAHSRAGYCRPLATVQRSRFVNLKATCNWLRIHWRAAGLRLKINAASLYVQDEISDKDRR